MQDRFQLATNGTELQQADVNLVAKEASLADDRVFAELLRLVPYNGSTYTKAILPNGNLGTPGATVQASTGAVLVNPFRAIVGSRTAVATSPSDNWQDIRSAVFPGGATTSQFTQAIGANASGNPRWDLVYVAVAVDQNGATLTRYQKNPATKVVQAQTIVTTLTTTATIGVVAGTPGATPAFPTLPADTASTFYIALAYVRVINGFGAATVLNNADIYEVASVVTLSRTVGVNSFAPANQQNAQGGTVLSSTAFPWTATTNTRPAVYLPPTMVGSESILIALDLLNASSANWSHPSLGVVDSSRDWRNRIFRYTAVLSSASNSEDWSFNKAGSTVGRVPNANCNPISVASSNNPQTSSGLGQSFTVDASLYSGAPASAMGTIYFIPSGAWTLMQAATAVLLYVDNADAGKLKVYISGAPQVRILIWLEASAPYTNF